MYIDKLFPFYKECEPLKYYTQAVSFKEMYIPVDLSTVEPKRPHRNYMKAVKIMPWDILVLEEEDGVIKYFTDSIVHKIDLQIREINYFPIAQDIEIFQEDDSLFAYLKRDGGIEKREIATDYFILNATKDADVLDISILPDKKKTMSVLDLSSMGADLGILPVKEASQLGKIDFSSIEDFKTKDSVYTWLDSYLSTPEGEEFIYNGKSGSPREVVPLLIGPTAVFKSATVKELCKKYDLRLVDFRVSFTSRLDYSGLFEIGASGFDDQILSYSCPMEELVTCSDGFRAFCKKAHEKVTDILNKGYLEVEEVSDGNEVITSEEPLTDTQREKLESLLTNYEYYLKTPVLFFDEITRCFSGNTKVRLTDGRILSMKELYEEFGTDKEFYVYACDSEGNVQEVPAKSLGITRENAVMVKITLDNDTEVMCTPDHKWMLEDGSYEQAQFLTPDSKLKSNNFSNNENVKHSILKVELVEDTEDAYDIEVPSYHNFLIDLGDDSGVFVHNCTDSGVEGILVQLLNQKRYNDMTMNGCKFIAATNLNISKTSVNSEYEDELNNIYDVNMDIDVAYANRFLPLNVYPEDVMDRWFEWADTETIKNGIKVKSIHPLIVDFLNEDRENRVYNNSPVIDAIRRDKSREEIKSQSFPNYRTWEMVSDYLYSVDDKYLKERNKSDNPIEVQKVIRPNIVYGLISQEFGAKLVDFLKDEGYVAIEETENPPVDDVTDFLTSTLDSGIPALLIGPSSLGKSSRVKQYAKKVKKETGLEPITINVNLSSMDSTDLMGMPAKQSLVDYVAKENIDEFGLGQVTKDLKGIIEDIQNSGEYGLVDSLTLRAPNKSIKDRFSQALKEGREVILFFDECNRCLVGSTMIKLSDGRILTIKEITDTFGTDNEFEVISFDGEKSVVGKAHSMGITRKDSELVRVTFENDTYIDCTPDHPFLLVDDSYVQAKDLGNKALRTSKGSISVKSVDKLDHTEDVYDINVDKLHNFLVYLGNDSDVFVHNCDNPTVMSAMFQCISDKSFAGISFKEQADKVKIVAACNMPHSEMFDDDNMGNYFNAGSIDPALAARFSVFWKKRFDEHDVESWIEFMEGEYKDGNIDNILLNFFKDIAENDMDKAVDIFSQVEKRTLETATPSTRMFYQLSKDIKSMRGNENSLFAGKVIFDDSVQQHYSNLNIEDTSMSVYEAFKYYYFYKKDVQPYIFEWEGYIRKDNIDIKDSIGNTVSLPAVDIVDTLEDIANKMSKYEKTPMSDLTDEETQEIIELSRYMSYLLSYILTMDFKYSNNRNSVFESYLGSDLSTDFTNYFNAYFGSDLDEEITLPMIVEDKLMDKFFRQYGMSLNSLLGDNEGIVLRTKNLVEEFYDVFFGKGTNVNTVKFLTKVKDVLEEKGSAQDTYVRFLTTLSGDKIDSVFKMAEESSEDKSWIIDLLTVLEPITKEDIENIENKMNNKGKVTKTRTSSIL